LEMQIKECVAALQRPWWKRVLGVQPQSIRKRNVGEMD